MSFLSGIISSIVMKLLEKLGSFFFKNYKTNEARKAIDSEEDGKAKAQQSIVDQLNTLDSLTVLAGSPEHKAQMAEIKRLEKELRDVSKRINAGMLPRP